MASGWTNKGRYKALGIWLRNETAPTTFYAALTITTAPDADSNTLGGLTEVAAGNGYTAGGEAVARSAVGFDVWTEDDTNDRGFIQLANVVWTASGGSIPSSGNGPLHMVLLDDDGTVGSREVYAFWDLVGPLTITVGQVLTVQDAELRIG